MVICHDGKFSKLLVKTEGLTKGLEQFHRNRVVDGEFVASHKQTNAVNTFRDP